MQSPDEVRATYDAVVGEYWTRQWDVIDPRVEPVRVSDDGAGHVVVDVHQVVRDRAGNLLSDRMVQHAYRLRDGRVVRMDIRPEAE